MKIAMVLGLLLGATSVASPSPAQTAGQASTAMSAASAPANLAEPDNVLTDGELGQLRGGENLILSNQTLVAITSGNVINGDYTAGSVSLSDSALSNFTGLGNLVINTGGQVSLQSGMNVTINVGE